MYNGIGLLTPRGSGTSGYVTNNKFNLRRAPVQQDEQRKEGEGPKQQKPNEEILLHKKKREIEVKLFELRLKLEDEDKLPPEEVEDMLAVERAVLEENFSKQKTSASAKSNAQETHEVAKRKMDQMEKIRKALGIAPGVKEGEAFDVELQEQRKKEVAKKREEMERERRRHAKEEKKRRDSQEATERRGGSDRKKTSKDDRHKTEEKYKSRERSPERERLSPPREDRRSGARREDSNRSRERPRRDDRWIPDSEKAPMDRIPHMDMHGGGRNARQEERGRPQFPPRRYVDDGPPPDYRYPDADRTSFRGRFYDRGRLSRGRGRRFPGRPYRPHEMSGPGYYRIGEAAPERYDPASDATDGRMEKEERWKKVDLDAEEQEKTKAVRTNAPREQDPNRVGAYVAEYDAHAALAGREGREKHSQRAPQSSPLPRSPNSMKQSPSQPKCHRRPPNYRSASPSPSSKEKEVKKNAEVEEKTRRSPSHESVKSSPRDRRKEKHRSERKPRSASPSGKSPSGDRSGRSRSRSTSRSRSMSSDRSRRNRRRGSMSYERRPPDNRRGGRYGGRWRPYDSNRGINRGGYRGYRRPAYGYNPHGGGHRDWRSDRRPTRRSRSRERRSRSRSFTRSSSSTPGERKRGRSSSSLSRRSSQSEKKRRLDETSPVKSKT